MSILSIQWSDNFSREECLALAEKLCQDGPATAGPATDTMNAGVVTLDSFRNAVLLGSVSQPSPSRGVNGNNNNNKQPGNTRGVHDSRGRKNNSHARDTFSEESSSAGCDDDNENGQSGSDADLNAGGRRGVSAVLALAASKARWGSPVVLEKITITTVVLRSLI